MRLTDSIPSWTGAYVGIPFEDRGRDRRGLDCWGLVRLVYAERLGVYLPSLTESYAGVDDSEGVGRVLVQAMGPAEDPAWQHVDDSEASVGDVARFRIAGGRRWHVGVLVGSGRMLHAQRGSESCIERIDAPLWTSRAAGVFRHAGPVRVSGRMLPLEGRRIDCFLEAGRTLSEILAAAGVEPLPCLRVYVGDTLVRPEMWDFVRPKPGRMVTVACAAAGGDGGGKTIIRIVTSIALIAAGAYLAQAQFLIDAVGKVGAAVVAGAGVIGLQLAISALAPPPRPRLSEGESSASPTIAGGRNDARPYEVIPCILGTHRVTPPLGALAYTENAGDDQYLRMLFVVGYGPLDISDIRIGETSILDYQGVELEVRSGIAGEDPIRLYPNTVREDPLNILLEQAISWQTRTSRTGADELAIDITFPQGLAVVNRDGSRDNRTVDVDVQYAVAGSGAWQSVNGGGGTVGSPVDARGLDLLFREPNVRLGGQPIHAARISWGLGFADPKPAYLPASSFSWSAEGWFRDDTAPPNGGNYTFGIDCSDAGDLEVDGRIVASWYGSHSTAGAGTPDFDAHASAAVFLPRGWHHIRVRVETRSTAGALAVGWKTPAAPGSWAVIPGSVFRISASPSALPGLQARWYSTETYLSTISTTAARTDQIRRTLSWAVPPGQYDVRVRRVTADTSDPQILDKVYWSALRTITNQEPIRKAGLARIAVRIKATDQLNGVIDTLNCLASSVVPDYDIGSGLWFPQATSNPASLYLAVLKGPGNARPVTGTIDYNSLALWWMRCQALGLEYNGVIDTRRTVYEVLADICAAGRASFGMRDGSFSVVVDQPHTAPVQHFTPRNSSGYKGRRSFPELPHGLRIRFIDRASGYQQVERIVLDDGYQIDGLDAFGNPAPALSPATKFESLELSGVTDAGQAWKHGRYHLAVARLRPEVNELTVDIEHLVANRGDMVYVTHDVPGWGQGYGRVLRLITDSSDVLHGLELDDEVTMVAGSDYRITVRLDSGAPFPRAVQLAPGTTRTVMFVSPVGAGEARPKVGDLYGFGIAGQETRELVIRSISVDKDLSASLELVDHAPAVHQADVGVIPPWDPGITRLPPYSDGPETPVIESIRSDDWVMLRRPDGSLEPRMVITLRRPTSSPPRPLPDRAQVRTRIRPAPPAEPTGPWTYWPIAELASWQVGVNPVEVGATYQVAVRVITPAGQASAWAESEHTVVGNIFPPPDVLAFDVVRLSDGTRRYSWDLGDVPPDVAGVVIRYSTLAVPMDWTRMTPLHTGVLDPASPQELNAPPLGTWRFAIKMVDTAGNESRNALFIERTLGAARQSGSIMTVDAGVLGWPGTKTDCAVRNNLPDGLILEAIDDARWDNLASVYGVASWAAWSRWSLAPRSPIAYEHPPIDLGAIVHAAPQAQVAYSGVPTIEFRYSSDGVNYSEYAPIDSFAGGSVLARYHQWRITVAADPSGGFFVPAIQQLLMDALAEPVEQLLSDVDTGALTGAYRLAVGDVRLPVDPGRFAIIRQVSLSFNGMGAGYTYVVMDRVIDPGPRIRIFNAAGDPADATVDAVVRGF